MAAAGSPEAGGAPTEPGAAGAGGHHDEAGGTTNAGGDATAGLAGSAAGAGGGPAADPTLLVTAPTEAIYLNGGWTELMPFVHQQSPHMLLYQHVQSALSSLQRLEVGRTMSTAVWNEQWIEDMTLARVAPAGKERFALYSTANGTRQLMGFESNLAEGPVQLDFNNVMIEPGFTHHASDAAHPLGFPVLYWYDNSNGRLHLDSLNPDGSVITGGFDTDLYTNYHALTALEGRLLGFHDGIADVWDLSALTASAQPLKIQDLEDAQRVVLFELDGLSLLLCYELTGNIRILWLHWADDAVSYTQLWKGETLPDARSVSGLALPNEFLIFVFVPLESKLQLISVKREPKP